MKVWRLWTKILLGLSIVAVVASGITAGVLYGTHTWVRNGCFTVNYVDLRGGYAPAPALYTSIGVIDDERNQNVWPGDVGKWHAGDSYCGPITYGVGQYGGIVFFGPRVDTKHEIPSDTFAPTNVGDAP
jgi:hypothetical protein